MREKKAPASTVIGEGLQEHPAVITWRRFSRGRSDPRTLEILKEKHESAVYRLVGAGPQGSNVIAKRTHRVSVAREQAVYVEVLPRLPVPTLQFFGAAEEPDGEFGWLFVEDAGEEWYSPDHRAHRALAGRWLGLLHTCVPLNGLKDRLPERGRAHYLERLRSSRDLILQRISSPSLADDHVLSLRSLVSQCDLVERHWGEVEAFCERMPLTLVHGDFVKKNVRVRNGGRDLVLLPFDWETAGWGTPAGDFVWVDMDAYWSVATERWPVLSEGDRQRLAAFGVLFRTIAAISWDVPGLKSTSWLHHAMRNLAVYEGRLAKIVRERGWSG